MKIVSSLVLIAVALLVLFLVMVVTRILFRRTGQRVDQPSCGACGYPTQGISELKCPECGADLKKVGIVKPGDGGPSLAGCLLPILVTILVIPLAVLGYDLAGAFVVSQYRQQSTHFDLHPASDQYAEVLVSTDLTIITPPDAKKNARAGLSISSNYNKPPVTSVTICGSGEKIRVEELSIEVMPKSPPPGSNVVTYAPRFKVDPGTRVASWLDVQGNRRFGKGPVSDMDVLAYLGVNGADTSNADVILEAQQLQGFMIGLLNSNHQFKLKNFKDGGYGSGSSSQLGPKWFPLTYAGAWFLIWIITLVLITRRAKKTS